MPLNPQIDPVHFVDLNSSDDEDGNVVTPSSSRAGTPSSGRAGAPPSLWASHQLAASSPASAGESRSFWRAGGYDVVSAPAASTAAGQLQRARVHPKFLHSNATSHKWAFGAIAELLDNAVDEICNGATFIKVDRIYNKRDNGPVLLFQDDGGGMDPGSMQKCMSLGYSSKNTNTTIGQYGNGFKTSTMRLGADAIVFSRKVSGSQATQSIGLLSYTFLRRTGQDDIIVPMVHFDIVNGRAQPIIHSSQEDWIDTFKIILDWSPFSSTEELMLQFEDIESHGTKIMVFNLWLNDNGVYELDFDGDEEDIRLRDEANLISMSKSPEAKMQSHISYCIRYSLRAYTSVLYLRKFTNFCIILRGKPVEQRNIADDLKSSRVLIYKPHSGVASKEASAEITIGFDKEAPILKVSGFNIYHKNRLIMPFWRAVHEGSSRGKGVVGFLEANFIEPAHDKQEFERTNLFIRLETKLRQIVLDYWKSNCYLIGLGLQPQILGTHDKKKAVPTKKASVGFQAHPQQQLPTEQPIIELASSLQSELRSDQHMIGHAAASDSIESSDIQHPIQQSVVRTAKFGEGFGEETTPGAIPGPALVDKIRSENMQLFLRCEEHRQKESELKQTIEKLESELAEARRRCSQLASTVEQRKKTVVSSLASPQ